MKLRKKINAAAICLLLLFASAASAALSGCTQKHQEVVYNGQSDKNSENDQNSQDSNENLNGSSGLPSDHTPEDNTHTPGGEESPEGTELQSGESDGENNTTGDSAQEGNSEHFESGAEGSSSGNSSSGNTSGGIADNNTGSGNSGSDKETEGTGGLGNGSSGNTGSTRPTTPGSSGSTRPTTPGSSGSTRPTTPGSSGSTRPTTPGSSGSTRPTTPGSSGSVKPTVPDSSGSTQSPVLPGENTTVPVPGQTGGTGKPSGGQTGNTSTVQSAASADFSNVVVFVQLESTSSANYYSDKTNEINKRWNTGERSLTNFLKLASNGKFTVNNIFPQYNASRNIYMAYTVPDSCVANSQLKDNVLVSSVIKQLSVDPSVNLDRNGDGAVDNLTIVVHRDNYSPGSNDDILWPHKSVYAGNEKVNGKYIRDYNVINSSIFTSIINSYGVISHEFMHSLGYPDLYRQSDPNAPVGLWDIMASSNDYMPYPLAYLRYRFSGWTNVSTVTSSSNRLTLSAQNSPNGTHAYILKNPSMSESEFFVAEYRKLGNSSDGSFTLDSRIPCYYDSAGKNGGIIIYRVNTNVEGLSNFGGSNGVYVFRPGVSSEAACGSDLKNAALSAESGRTGFGNPDLDAGIADNALTYSNGANSGIVIKNVGSAAGNTITFDVEFAGSDKAWSEEVSGSADSAYASDVSLVINPLGNVSVAYAGSTERNGLHVATASGKTWTKATPLSSQIWDAKTLVWNRKQYILYRDSSGLYMAGYSSGILSDKKLVSSGVQDYTATAASDGIYIAYTDSQMSSKLSAVRYNGSLTKLIDRQSIGNAGTLSAAYAGGSLYVAYRAWSDNNAVKVLKVSDKSYLNTSGISGSYFSMTSDGNSLYLAVGTESSSGYMQVYKCSGGSASFGRLGGNISRGNIQQLDIAVNAQGVFILCVNQTTDKTEVFRYSGSGWDRFGSQLEGTSILDAEIELVGSKVIVAYINNGKIYVRSKTF